MASLLDQRRFLIPFRSSLLPQIFTDTLVIGGGAAGLSAAISAANHGECIVLSKGTFKQTNTSWAQGGIAAAMAAEDTTESHITDTLEAGTGLCDPKVVREVVEAAPAAMRRLINWGARFDSDASGKLSLGREGGHSFHRILHAHGDATGREVQRALVERVRDTAGIRVFEQCFALDLITPTDEVGAPVMGAITYHQKYGLQVIWAKATILASGGAGVLFRETTNPIQATADGLAMAYRAGASLACMAFMQFHPTTLYLPGASRSLITEAVRGDGAHLLDATGHRFMRDVHPLAELAPRDVVSQAIVRQIAKQGGSHVWLDCRHLSNFAARFPGIAQLLKQFELNPSKDLIPIHPAAHYMVGGIHADVQGRTDVPGLYAVGEAAYNGLHGANRLASNSLLEGLVVGETVGRICAEMKPKARPSPMSIVSDIRPSEQGELDLSDVKSSLRSAMWKNVGVERTGNKLRDVTDMLDFWARYTLDKIFDEPAGWEIQNLLLVGGIVARSSMWRQESRGCHYRVDHPLSKEEYRVHDLWRRRVDGPTLIEVAAGDLAPSTPQATRPTLV
ncbi:MAG: L-aspartate oxidase [Planctomycetes bacterium]|nr:L-aspartate oxidase [Planctomycetota bacterium]